MSSTYSTAASSLSTSSASMFIIGTLGLSVSRHAAWSDASKLEHSKKTRHQRRFQESQTILLWVVRIEERVLTFLVKDPCVEGLLLSFSSGLMVTTVWGFGIFRAFPGANPWTETTSAMGFCALPFSGNCAQKLLKGKNLTTWANVFCAFVP